MIKSGEYQWLLWYVLYFPVSASFRRFQTWNFQVGSLIVSL
ncbi:rCG60070 [Rattus norvegicus]|uniref:RCG60070 n=1 Tax=Rattus norvegicus TaxID=10116 RepID=A6HR93_RAT|nr:rCG60070 [Rattus norvegicus]